MKNFVEVIQPGIDLLERIGFRRVIGHAISFACLCAFSNYREGLDPNCPKWESGLFSAARNAKSRRTSLAISRDIAHKPEPIRHTGEKLRVMLGGFPAIPHMVSTLKEFEGAQPPTVLLIEGTGDSSAEAFCKLFDKAWGKKVTLLAPGAFGQKLVDGKVYVAD